jgi:hypothetical protein
MRRTTSRLDSFHQRRGGIINHSVGWNGHTLVGYCLALVVTFLIGAKMVSVHDFPSAPTSVSSSFSGAGWATSGGKASDPVAPFSAAREASSCDKLQDAIQTGREAEIIASLQAIVADKTVNVTAREDARHYIGQDKASKSAQGRIQFYCHQGPR